MFQHKRKKKEPKAGQALNSVALCDPSMIASGAEAGATEAFRRAGGGRTGSN